MLVHCHVLTLILHARKQQEIHLQILHQTENLSKNYARSDSLSRHYAIRQI